VIIMKAVFLALGFLLLVSADEPSEEENSQSANPKPSNEEQQSGNSEEADPFVSDEKKSGDDEKGSDLNSSINLTENKDMDNDEAYLSNEQPKDNLKTKDESNLSMEKESNNATPGSLESLSMSENKNSEMNQSKGLKSGNELFEIGGDKSSDKPVSRYWTEVVIDNKSKNVLVNIKTVTIIESISTIKSTEPPKVATNVVQSSTVSQSVAPEAFPYIKIQMPSSTKPSKSTVSSSKSSSAVSKSVKSIAKAATSTVKAKTASVKKAASSKKASASKSTQSVTLKPISITSVPSTAKSSSVSVVSSSVIKADGFANPKTTTKSIQPKSVSAEDPSSVGSIFNVLKNLPTGGKESASVYVEGTFKFPKKKEISNKVFKLSGYVSQA
jgi:hypothetical protein